MMRVREEDLTAAARIRNAALVGFAERGVTATSIRDVAKSAGVSPGLVQHHFKSKDALRSAVNDYVVQIVAAAFADVTQAIPAEDLVAEIGDRITSVVREHHHALLYVARAAAEGDEPALGIFDAFVALAGGQIDRLGGGGFLWDGVDERWAALQVVILNLATVLLEPAINRHLEAPWRSAEQLERWNKASTQLFRSGVFRSKPQSKPKGKTGKARRKPATAMP